MFILYKKDLTEHNIFEVIIKNAINTKRNKLIKGYANCGKTLYRKIL